MFAITKNIVRLGAVALGIISISFSPQISKAQNTTADSFNFDDIAVEREDGWQFTSENETISLQDEIQELGEYRVSGAENFDVKLIQGNRRGGSSSDFPSYSVEDKASPYYSIKTEIYDY